MSNYHYALQSVGKDVLIIKDNKVIAEGKSELARSNNWTGIQLISGELFEQLKTMEPWLTLHSKYVYIHYSSISGSFLSISNFDETEELKPAIELLEYTRTVDKFNFGWGTVPDTFKDVEGYRSSFIQS